VLEKEPGNAFGLFYLAEMFASQGQKEAAEAHWQTIADQYPGTEIAKMAEQRIHEVIHSQESGSN
jgi:TolA-binding protein